MQPPRSATMRLSNGIYRRTGLFHPQREADYKTTGRNSRSILMSSADRVAHIDGHRAIIVSNTHALPAEYKCLKQYKKTEHPFTNVCWVSVLTTFPSAPQILAASTVFFCPIPETKKWWVMVSFGATAAGLFWTVNVCWAHPVISRPAQ